MRNGIDRERFSFDWGRKRFLRWWRHISYQPPWRLTRRKQGKAFFFEKKKQKAFVCAVADSSGEVRISARKSFLVLFLEKGLLASHEPWSRPVGIQQVLPPPQPRRSEGRHPVGAAYPPHFIHGRARGKPCKARQESV
jgi:hypothetical protein